MPTKSEISQTIFDELTTNLDSFSHSELLKKKIDLIKNIPASDGNGFWRDQAKLLCGLIDNKITTDKLSQSAWKEWGQPIVLDLFKIGIVSSITFASGYFLAKPAPVAASQESVNTSKVPQTNTQQSTPLTTASVPAKKP